MKIDTKLVELAKKTADKSSCRYRVSAIGLNRYGKIIATAYNRPRLNRLGGGLHAELEVIRKGGPAVCSIILCRIGNAGKLRIIHPCEFCSRIVSKLGIKIYTLNLNE